MHLEIIQRTDATEMVNSTVVEKLYQLAYENIDLGILSQLDLTSNLEGNISPNAAYKDSVDYLREKFPNLYITISDNDCYIRFADDNVKNILLSSGIGDGVGITLAQAANATIGTALRGNTTITSFNEFGYFTKANNSPVNEMFKGCTNLKSIDLSNITSITTSLFSLTAITDINAPDLISYTGYSLFSSCSQLKTISSLGHISAIPNSCFFGSYNLETVNLPDECIRIELAGFFPSYDHMGSLTKVNGIDHVLSFGEKAFNRLSSLHLYSLDLYNATSIGVNAFWFVKVHSIDCPNLTNLGASAFRENPVLTGVDCLGKISSIPEHCFNTNTALQTVKIPYECVSIGTSAFYGCSSLTSITQYNKSLDDYAEGESPIFTDLSRITSFGSNCFYNCSLLLLTQQDIQNATTIGGDAFSGVSLLSGTLNLPNLTGKLGRYSFYATGISSISSLGTVTEIGDRAFAFTNISSITIPNSVKKCACSFVSDTVVPEIIFPEGVEEISNALFLTKNNSLTYIEIPSTVTNMEHFFHRSLESSLNNLCIVVIKATVPPTLTYYRDTAADDTKGEKFAGIYVPDASLTAYQNGANAWQHSSIQAKLKPISQLQTDNPTAWAKYNRTSTV